MTPANPIIDLRLPYPPSVNSYWRSVVIRRRVRVLVSEAGREYRDAVLAATPLIARQRLTGRLAVSVLALPPDRRRRDLDNILKAALDALQFAGVYVDDSQIDEISVTRGPPCAGGEIHVTIAARDATREARAA